MKVRTQFGGRRLWLGAGEGPAKAGAGAGEGCAKAREELTSARQGHPSENCPLWAFIFQQQQGQPIET